MSAEIHYTTNYLTTVIVRLDFVSELGTIAQKIPESVSRSLIGTFPIPEPKTGFQQQLTITPQRTSRRRAEFTEWHFHGKEREKTAIVSPRALILSYSRYESFGATKGEFLNCAQALFSEYPNAQGSRLGLRYINEFTFGEGGVFDWADYLHRDILAPLGLTTEPSNLSRSMHNMELSFNGKNLKFQFGISNPDYPARVRRRHFVLDLDAYYQGPMGLDDVKSMMDELHDLVQRYFEISITDRTRAVLNAAG